jgi:hypothetical protein
LAAAALLAGFTLAAPAAQAAPRGSVLVVGDSLEELSSPYLSHYLPGVELTVNAVGGSNTFEVLALFEESYDPSQQVIVFDGGTNDNPNYPQILEENLAKVAATVGPDRCMVVPTVHGYTVEGTGNEGKNSVVRRFAASRPGTQVPEWARFEHEHPELMQSDGLHPIEAGSEQRAQLIAQGILGCLAYEESGGVTTALASASAPTDVKTTHLQPVTRMAKREAALAKGSAAGPIHKAAILAVLRSLFPGG